VNPNSPRLNDAAYCCHLGAVVAAHDPNGAIELYTRAEMLDRTNRQALLGIAVVAMRDGYLQLARATLEYETQLYNDDQAGQALKRTVEEREAEATRLGQKKPYPHP
jgi:hypothetical protein